MGLYCQTVTYKYLSLYIIVMQLTDSSENKMRKFTTMPACCMPLNGPKTSIQGEENLKTEYAWLELTRFGVEPNSKRLVEVA